MSRRAVDGAQLGVAGHVTSHELAVPLTHERSSGVTEAEISEFDNRLIALVLVELFAADGHWPDRPHVFEVHQIGDGVHRQIDLFETVTVVDDRIVGKVSHFPDTTPIGAA